MVIGQSRYFSLVPPSGVDISAYTATYTLYKSGVVVKTGSVANTGTKFIVAVQTTGLSIGTYELRVFITDPSDGFVDVVKDKWVLEK